MKIRKTQQITSLQIHISNNSVNSTNGRNNAAINTIQVEMTQWVMGKVIICIITVLTVVFFSQRSDESMWWLDINNSMMATFPFIPACGASLAPLCSGWVECKRLNIIPWKDVYLPLHYRLYCALLQTDPLHSGIVLEWTLCASNYGSASFMNQGTGSRHSLTSLLPVPRSLKEQAHFCLVQIVCVYLYASELYNYYAASDRVML